MTSKFATASLLAALSAVSAIAQTTSSGAAAKRPATRRTTASHATPSAAKTNATSASTADTPANIPAVEGLPKPLYALRYIDITVGTGPVAEPRKYYTVKYTGWLTDGTKFDSSYDHPGAEPITFPYGARQVISGWDTGFEGMHVGGKRRLFIPYQLAYGESGRPPVIPAKADLIFDIELVSISATPPAAPEPPQPASSGSSSGQPGSGASSNPASGASSSPAPAGSSSPSSNPAAPPPTQSTTPETKPRPSTTTNP